MTISELIYSEGDIRLTRERINVDAAYDAGTVVFATMPDGVYSNSVSNAAVAAILLDTTTEANQAGALARNAKVRLSQLTLPTDADEADTAVLMLYRAGVSIYDDTGA